MSDGDLFDEDEAGLAEERFEQDGPGLFDEPEPAPAEAGPADADATDIPVSAPPAPERRQVPTAPEAPLALYRRYRPDTFAEVIGQEHVTVPLQRALENNRVNHAYLFSGPRGCGKTSSARILARCLNCERGPTPVPCGECQSCRDLATGGPGSIDVIEIDAASHGGVDDARDLRERAFFAPVSSRYKIYIIDEAHMVTTQGFNALLKLVEEPPPHVKFVFATTEPEKVIGTIRSRTHHYPFRLVPPKVLASYLARICDDEHVEIEPAALPLVVRAGAGSVRDSLSVLDQLLGGAGTDGVTYAQATALLGFTPDALLDEMCDAFAAGDASGVFACVDKVIEVGQDPRRFAEDLLRRLRDLIVVGAVPDATASGLVDVSPDQAERLTTQASGLGLGELTRAAGVIAAGLTEMRGTTAPRLHLELMCARVLLPGADVDERGLAARLDRLERRLGMIDADGSLAPGEPTRPDPGTSAPQPPATPRAAAAAPPRAQAGPAAPPPDAPTAADDDQAERPIARRRAATGERRRPPSAVARGVAADDDAAAGAGPDSRDTRRPAASEDRDRGASEGPTARPACEPSTAAQPVPHEPEGPGDEPSGASRAEADPRAGQPPAGSGTEPTTAQLRQVWPQILDEVRQRRRYTWILLSQHAQVHDVSDGILTLQLSNPGARDSWDRGGNSDVLREAIVEQIAVDLRIQTIVDAGSPAGPGRQAEPPRATPEPERRGRGVSRRPNREVLRTDREAPPEEPPPDEGDYDRADPDYDVGGADSDTLLRETLGAQPIDEG